MNALHRGILTGFIVCSVMAAGGCQTIRNSKAASEEKMLAAAGFQMKQAQTPEQLADLKNMPQRKLIPHTKDGQVMYVYADAELSQCVYVGTENNYQRYQNMVFQQQLADEQSMNNADYLDWEVWGPWGPWGAWDR